MLLLGLGLRVYGLNLNPVGISHDDELNEMLNAKSVALTGEHRPGFVAGILTQNDQCNFLGDCVYGELGTYFQVPWMIFFPLDLTFSRMFFVIISLGLIFVTGKLFENFSGNKIIGLLTGLFIAINPWAIYYGRTAHTILISHLLYILAAYFFTRPKTYKLNLLIGSIVSLIASLVYFGGKPIAPMIIIWGGFYNLYQLQFKNFKFILTVVLVSLLIFGFYFYLLSHSFAGKRIADAGGSDKIIANPQVMLGGNVAWAINRQVDKITPRLDSFLGFFSIPSLFLTGQQQTDNYYLSGHGYFYLVDFIILVFGIMALAGKPKIATLIFLLITTAVIPAAIKTSQTSIYSHRTSLAYPLICGVIAWGIFYLWTNLSKLKFRSKFLNLYVSKVFLVLGIFIYSGSLVYFLFVYWFKTPVEQSTRWFFQERVLSNYLTHTRQTNHNDIIILSARPDGIFNSYVFYSGIYNNPQNIKRINNLYSIRNYNYDGILFTEDCSRISTENLNKIIIVDQINNAHCHLNLKPDYKIANPKDSGAIFNISNDKICSNFSTNAYSQPQSIYDFNIESQSNEFFCKMWINKT